MTGEEAWFNHVQVFHGEAARFEYRHIVRRQPSLRALGVCALLEGITAAKRRLRSSERFATHCTYADGGEIPTDDIRHLIDVFWRNMVFPRWRRGDVAVIDAADPDSPSEVLDAMADTGCLPRRLVICAPGPLRDREAEKFSAVLQKPFDFEQLVAAIFGPSGHRRRPARSGLFPRMRACVRTPRRAARGRRGHG